MKVLTVRSPEIPDGGKCQAEGKQTPFQFITLAVNLWPGQGQTVTVFLFPKLFLNVNAVSQASLKTFLKQELAY